MTPLPKPFLKTEIVFAGRIPGLNKSDGLAQQHWSKAKRVKAKYLLEAMSCSRNRHTGPVRIELIRHSTGGQMDYDNLVSTGKHLIDAIVKAGILPDDNPAVIVERSYTQTKALNAKSQMTVIRIIDIEDAILP